MMRNRHWTSKIAVMLSVPVLAVGALALSGCGQDRVTYTPAHGSEHPSASAGDGDAAGSFSHADIMFAQMMIPHHEQAIEMSDLAATRAADERVKNLAVRIKAAQAPEIAQMQKWVADSGMGDMHSMMDDAPMAGMLSAQELSKLKAAKGAEFDRLFLTSMTAHHQGAIDMASASRDSNNNEVSDLANQIISSQTSEIEEMQGLLAQLP